MIFQGLIFSSFREIRSLISPRIKTPWIKTLFRKLVQFDMCVGDKVLSYGKIYTHYRTKFPALFKLCSL